jgi:hypothetical protein
MQEHYKLCVSMQRNFVSQYAVATWHNNLSNRFIIIINLIFIIHCLCISSYLVLPFNFFLVLAYHRSLYTLSCVLFIMDITAASNMASLIWEYAM